jgi:hypothetical protein
MPDPVVEDIEPAEESVDQRPQNAVVEFPAQQGGQNRPDAAQDAASATAAASVVFVSHFRNQVAWRPFEIGRSKGNISSF